MTEPAATGTPGRLLRLWRWIASRPVTTLIVGAFASGIVFWGSFNTAMEATNTLPFCIGCHEMRSTVYAEYRSTIHFQNRTGVRATCSDCHVPDPWIYKVARKIQATNELFHWVAGSINTAEKFEAKRLDLARRVWASMKDTDSRECRNCHTLDSMNPEFQRPRARKQHLDAMISGQTCIDCHKGIAHNSPRERLTEAEIERLEQPNPKYVRVIPETYLEGLKRVETREAAAEEQRRQETAAAEAAVTARIAAAVAQALAQSSPAAAAASSAGIGGAIAWDAVEPTILTLFYPGQASYEWMLTGKDHGGARAFLRGGDRCASCHIQEVKDMGAKIVSGQKVETTPIPGKRPAIDVVLRATHDDESLYLRFEWPDAPHTPAPFVNGGKMDPQNQTKIAMMIAGTGVERAEQAGCWLTCHHDARSMPGEPPAAALAASPAAKRRELLGGITKYLGETRTEIEMQGSAERPRGGWDKLKPEDDIAALRKAGTVMDLLRFRSGGAAENGYVLAGREMGGGAPIATEGRLEAGRWTVTMKRPLRSDEPGDVTIEPGKTYVVGFAIHDDYTNARFHHVSLEYTFGLDTPGTEINVRKR